MPMEGFYVLTNAFPWGLLALLSIEQGQLCARMVRFLPQGESITEIQVPFFQVSVSEERGNIRSVIQAPWLQFDSMATIAPIESSQLVASTQESHFFSSQNIGELGLFQARRAFRLEAGDNSEKMVDKKPATAAGVLGYPYGLQDYLDESEEIPEVDESSTLSKSWAPGRLGLEGELKQRTDAMLRELLSRPRFCDLALIRSPDEFMPADPTVPRLRPGLYAGDYGHGMYGQYRVEVLLLDYVSLTAEEVRAEIQDPQRLFKRPGGHYPAPGQLRALAELNQSITFMRVVKQCGDLHVPMGATTFVAICAPENALDGAQNGPSRVQNRQTSSWESVARSWRGFGTLAMPGFGRPSWDTGWLVQFAHRAGEDRFGFVWDRAQDAVVLKWIGLQDTCPFLQRSWLPEDVR
ncbi:unnamed protein product [Durusdinium trenchii]